MRSIRPARVPALRTVAVAGLFVVEKARDQQAVSGTFQAAKNLRKQGVPLHLALAILRTPR